MDSMVRVTLFTIVCFFIAKSSFSQEVKVVRKSGEQRTRIKASEQFHFLSNELDTSRVRFVATIQVVTTETPSMEKIYLLIKDEAQKLGANAIRLNSLSDSTHSLLADAYFADGEALKLNRSLKPRNVFYIFAGDKSEKATYYSFEFNGGAKTLKNGTYFEYALKEGEQVKLKKGVVAGTTMWIKWKPDQLPLYYSIHGFYKEPVVKRTTVSESVKPGKFLPVESDLGDFLVAVLARGGE